MQDALARRREQDQDLDSGVGGVSDGGVEENMDGLRERVELIKAGHFFSPSSPPSLRSPCLLPLAFLVPSSLAPSFACCEV
jgi:hypothetical protein